MSLTIKPTTAYLVMNIVRELELLGPREREQMFAAVAKHLVEGTAG